MNRKIALLLICLIASTGATTVAADDLKLIRKFPKVSKRSTRKARAALNHVALVDT